jgi:hypothetical protein
MPRGIAAAEWRYLRLVSSHFAGGLAGLRPFAYARRRPAFHAAIRLFNQKILSLWPHPSPHEARIVRPFFALEARKCWTQRCIICKSAAQHYVA